LNTESPKLELPATNFREPSFTDTWFEVVQRRGENDEDITVVGLYKTEEEAEECKGLKQELSEKRAKNDTSYFIRVKK